MIDYADEHVHVGLHVRLIVHVFHVYDESATRWHSIHDVSGIFHVRYNRAPGWLKSQ